ncbi:hypothetical protein WOLCODRAFT_76356 [Wolfiporia cocos MD-104 SS10]|uniref:Zn(2)-C6 fungal-type domain-containing protein n=1 Tax=Wolfiporia cocos (strain MD-104) TaxID=742152 RepID=A0A2H3K2N6_WOLCO|nr:hypothetical protein WOLCODRAFT_76356 [Wolfiporia cocos MD-104 SS10]
MSSLDATPVGPVANGNGAPANGAAFAKKRKRGATRLSCAECRRLKLRCDRQIPCGSCIKRGCSAICPDGSLTTGKGNRRFVLASTQELHEKIAQLSTRIRDLEDGLRQSHAHQSVEQHPLLTEDLLLIKAPIQREGLAQLNVSTNNNSHDDSSEVVDSFGSLAISDTGRTSYFGQATSSWVRLSRSSQDDDRDHRRASLRQLLPPEILALSGVFPVAPHIPHTDESESDRLERLRTLFWYLPPADEAAELRQIYFQHAAWMYNPLSRSMFDEQAYNVFYNTRDVPSLDDALLAHQLALMFMVLSIGSLMDLARPAYNIEAEKYHQLARAALFQSPVFEEPTLAAVQALYLMAFYLFLSERHGTGVGTRWAFMGLAVKLSVSVHRDAGRWKVEQTEIQRRRELFWEVFSYDLLQSFTLGRPPSFSLAHIDCKKPYTEDPCNEETFHWWKHKFTSECMNSVYDQAFGAKTPTYSTVLQLDRKLRNFPVPPLLQIAGFGMDARVGNYTDSVPLILQRHTVLAIRESHLLYMHRGFFARAISDHPEDPLGSPYGSSFIAAYRSAGSLVALVRNIHSQLKELTERMWFLWTHLFSCSIILGSIVTRCPSMSLAPSALAQLDSACELFAKTAHFFHAESVLTIIQNLREKAHASLAAYRNSPPHGIKSEPTTPADAVDELNILGGRTRLVASKEKSQSPQIPDRSPTSLNPIVPLPLKDTDWQDERVHPSVVQYLRTFVASPMPGPSSMYNGYQPRHNQSPTGSMHQHSPSFERHPHPQQPHHPHQHPQQQQQQLAELSPIATSFRQMSEAYQQNAGGLAMQVDPMQQGFPQYFPVFDYGPAGDMYMPSPANSLDGGDPRSYSPEGNPQAVWQDFVSQMQISAVQM